MKRKDGFRPLILKTSQLDHLERSYIKFSNRLQVYKISRYIALVLFLIDKSSTS
jgi:hypothetical protein